MKKTLKRDFSEIRGILREASEKSKNEYKSYAYIAGYYEVLLAELIDEQTYGRQRSTLQDIQRNFGV
jgi:hypothetical protein